MSKVDIEKLIYKKPDLRLGLNSLIDVNKLPEEELDPSPTPGDNETPVYTDNSTGTGGL